MKLLALLLPTLTQALVIPNGTNKNIAVISPPGGVGEVAAVSSAIRGASVKWFILQQENNSKVSISQEVLSQISANNGKIELAGALASDYLDNNEKLASAWIQGSVDAVICTTDCTDFNKSKEVVVLDSNVEDAVKCAVQEVCAKNTGCKKVVISNKEYLEEKTDEGGFLGSLFKADSESVPASLSAACGSKPLLLNHGSLFGLPGAPAFQGGPRRDPILREEYILGSLRLDAASSSVDKSVKSSRTSLGNAAALMALGVCDGKESNLDTVLTLRSLVGDAPTDDEWVAEFDRALDASTSLSLFTAEFASVPSIPRLTDWLATKWAPAVIKSYDIATIRSGDRPVYATAVNDGEVQVVWQNLVNFETVYAGKMIIKVTAKGIEATKEMASGYKKLQGEKVLVRRLADAYAQAIEKGLAVKPKVAATKIKAEPVAVAELAKVSTTVVSSGDVAASSAGPKSAGATRSSQRARGSRRSRKTTTEDSGSISPDASSDSFQ